MNKDIDKNVLTGVANTLQHGVADNSLVAPSMVENKPFDGDINSWDVADIVELAKQFEKLKYPRTPEDASQWKLDARVVVQEKIYGESMTAVYKTDESGSTSLDILNNTPAPSDDTPSGP